MTENKRSDLQAAIETLEEIAPHGSAFISVVILQARRDKNSEEWTNIYPAQLEAFAKNGYQVRAIESNDK